MPIRLPACRRQIEFVKSTGRKQLLMLVHRVPYPPNRGDRIRSYHLLRHLAAEYDVHLATLCDEPVSSDAVEALKSICRRVEIASVTGSARWLRAAWSLARGFTATEGLFRSPRLADVVRRWASQTRFDAALVFCSSMLQYLDCAELGSVRAVVDLVDVDSQKWFDYADRGSGAKRWLFRLEGRRLRKLEQRAIDRATAVTLVSEAEAELFRRVCPNDKTVAIPNGVDLDYFRPQNDGTRPWIPLPPNDRTNLVFIGALDYRANIDGITWFASEVWPLLRREMPQLTLGLVGRNPAPAVRKLADIAGIRVFGTVPDVRPFLAAADLVIAPLRIARGIQNKVLEAMAMGKPVICSPGALEGIDAVPQRDLLLAAAPKEWLVAVRRMFGDAELRQQIAQQGRELVQREYSWNLALAPLDGLFAPCRSLGNVNPSDRVPLAAV
jgi:sugar transferase (PEP-CTERM/EpsH1 system associated)